MARRVITLEIDSAFIKILEAIEGKVTRWASLSLVPGVVEEGVVSDPAALSAALHQLMASSGIKGKDVVASVNGLYSSNRIIAIPYPSMGVPTSQAVMDTAKDVMPIATDNLYLSWQTLTTIENIQQVLVLGIPQDVVDTEVQALKAAGINPRIMDFKAVALSRTVNRDNAFILNIEATSFDIVMLVHGIPEIMRTIAWQYDELSLEDSVEHLALNLELTVGFFNSHHPDAPLDTSAPLFVTGQLSGNPSLLEQLQSRVDYKIESPVPPLACPVHLPVSQYAVNIGLALCGTLPPKNLEPGEYFPPNINILPDIYKPWKPTARQLYISCFIIAAIALLIPLYRAATGALDRTAELESQYNTLNNKLQQRQIEIKNRAPLQDAINQYRTIVDMGGGFADDINFITSEAHNLDIYVKSTVRDEDSLAILCEADSYDTFRKYLSVLEASGRFSSPIPPPEGYPYTKAGDIELTPKSVELAKAKAAASKKK